MSSQCTVCQLFALYLKVCEEIKQQIWVAGLAQLRIVEVFRFPPPLKVIQLFELCRTVLGIRRCFELAFYPGFGWFRFMTHWQGVETTFGSPVSRLTWLGGQRTTFAGEHSLGDLFEVEHQWPIAFRWSFRCLASMGLTCLGMASSFLYSGIGNLSQMRYK